GLWTLISPVARPINLETMGNKKLAIDSSIWLYQFQNAIRDREGKGLANSHILGFVRRISKLLYYGVKPVFVFDGGAPQLKKQTINERRARRRGGQESLAKTAEKLLAAQLRQAAVMEAQSRKYRTEDTGEIIGRDAVYFDQTVALDFQKKNGVKRTLSDPQIESPAPSPSKKPKHVPKDQYQLPPMEDLKAPIDDGVDHRLATEQELNQFIHEFKPEDLDINSPQFQSLSTELKYEIIGDLRLKSRQPNRSRVEAMRRTNDHEFSQVQILNLKQRNELTQKLLTVTDMVAKANLTIPVKIAAQRNKEYVLVKGQEGWILGIENNSGDSANNPVRVDSGSEEEEEDDEIFEEVDVESQYRKSRSTTNSLKPDQMKFGSSLNPTKANRSEQQRNFRDAIRYHYGSRSLNPDTPDEHQNKKNGPFGLSVQDDQNLVESSPDPSKHLTIEPKDKVNSSLLIQSEELGEVEIYSSKIARAVAEHKSPGLGTFNYEEIFENKMDLEVDEDFLVGTDFEGPEDQVILPEKVSQASALENKNIQGSKTQSINTLITDSIPPGPSGDRISSTAHQEIIEETERYVAGPMMESVPEQSSSGVTLAQDKKDTEPVTDSSGMEAFQDPTPTTDFQEVIAISASGFAESTPKDNSAHSPNSVVKVANLEDRDSQKSPKGTQKSASRSGSPEVFIPWSRSPTPRARPPQEPSVIQVSEDEEDLRRAVEAEEDELVTNLVQESSGWDKFLSGLKDQDKLEKMRNEADIEVDQLKQQRAKDRRQVDDVNIQMTRDIQALLKLFGIPFVVSPMEAEAQCAELMKIGLVDGIITDDSDVFLFGGTRVYKNMFNQNKFVECYLMVDLEKELGLGQDKLIQLAYLLGSDYANGLNGVGPVTAMEILNEFDRVDQNDKLGGLINFKNWWKKVQIGKETEEDLGTSFRRKFVSNHKTIWLDDDWPIPAVAEAYYNPTVDSSKQKFTWGLPDLDGLRDFLQDHLTWSSSKTDELILPLIKRQTQRISGTAQTQGILDNFFDYSIGNGTSHAPPPR
ncbi:hypothetical protein PPACK8108_LOCUS5255, partial [Phakopsora pachyrhizi]